MTMVETKIKITGIAPLIVHSSRLVDPLDEMTIALSDITKKRKKTLEDHRKMAELEWKAGIYVDADGYPIVPGSNIEACIRDGAKKARLGKQVQAGVLVLDDPRIEHSQSKLRADALWDKPEYRLRFAVRVTTARVMRTRPIFYKWALTFRVNYDDSLIGRGELASAIDAAGYQSGLGEWRPRNGRFEVAEMT